MRAALTVAAALVLLAGAGAAHAQKRSAGSPLLPGGDAHAPVNVKADRLQYFSKQRRAVYSGHVVARQGDGSLQASSLTIYFSGGEAAGAANQFGGGGAQQINRMVAAGPVTIQQKDQIGVGDTASYERATNQVVLSGDVSLTEGPNVVKGDRLIYDLGAGQAQVVGRVTSLFVPGSGGPGAAKPGRAERRKPHAATAGRGF